jgi:hypothetical protein
MTVRVPFRAIRSHSLERLKDFCNIERQNNNNNRNTNTNTKLPPPPSYADYRSRMNNNTSETSGIELGPTNNSNNNSSAPPSHYQQRLMIQQQQQQQDIPLTSDVAMIDHDDYNNDNDMNDEQRYQAEFLRHATTVTAPEDYAYAANGSSKTQQPSVIVVLPSGQILSPDAAAQSQAVAYQEAMQLQNYNHPTTMMTNPSTVGVLQQQQQHPPHRTGHSYCGCCCDMRRAVTIINIMNAILTMIFIIFYGIGSSDKSIENAQAFYDDDSILNNLELAQDTRGIMFGILLTCWIGMILGIRGAQTYTVWMVWIASIVYCCIVTMSIVLRSLPIAILAAFFVYPHFVLIHELQRGTMTAERYNVEQQSCCCV